MSVKKRVFDNDLASNQPVFSFFLGLDFTLTFPHRHQALVLRLYRWPRGTAGRRVNEITSVTRLAPVDPDYLGRRAA